MFAHSKGYNDIKYRHLKHTWSLTICLLAQILLPVSSFILCEESGLLDLAYVRYLKHRRRRPVCCLRFEHFRSHEDLYRMQGCCRMMKEEGEE
jgi:hypothetical protein